MSWLDLNIYFLATGVLLDGVLFPAGNRMKLAKRIPVDECRVTKLRPACVNVLYIFKNMCIYCIIYIIYMYISYIYIHQIYIYIYIIYIYIHHIYIYTSYIYIYIIYIYICIHVIYIFVGYLPNSLSTQDQL